MIVLDLKAKSIPLGFSAINGLSCVKMQPLWLICRFFSPVFRRPENVLYCRVFWQQCL
jgi:hypothetical protein